MKIAYIINPDTYITGDSNGIRSQALTWKRGLEKRGHNIVLISQWGNYDWGSFDLIHLFGSSDIWFLICAKSLLKKNTNIVWSPICDEIANVIFQRFKTYIGFHYIKLFSFPYIRKLSYNYFKKVYVRSEYEKKYLHKVYGVPYEKMVLVRLPLSYNEIDKCIYEKKEQCLHISSIYQSRKNVVRLIKASIKYNFKLILAGCKGTDAEFKPLQDAIGNSKNILVKGFISEEEKIQLYKESKVFALPSINEGVGIVALDAAHFGCKIAITKIGGPKEYFNDMVETVNPYSVDDIGSGIIKLLNSKNDLLLKEYVDKEFSEDVIISLLINSYMNIINKG